MKFGFVVSVRGPLADANGVIGLVQAGDRLGFEYASVTDHIVVPREIGSKYPYSQTGAFPGEEGTCLETLSMLAFIAGATQNIRLVTSVMVVPHRPPVQTAKMIATIDVLSRGRVTVGAGVGWMREEFAAIGAPDFDARGRVTDDYLRAFKAIWTEDKPHYDGMYAHVDPDVMYEPKPVQKPHPPIWIGGESDAAMRRTVALGDGWYPMGLNPKRMLDTPERFAAGIARLHEFAEKAGRDPASIDLAYIAPWYDDRNALTAPDGTRRAFTGGRQAIIDDIGAYTDLGVRTLILTMARRTLDRSVENMTNFARDIRPAMVR